MKKNKCNVVMLATQQTEKKDYIKTFEGLLKGIDKSEANGLLNKLSLSNHPRDGYVTDYWEPQHLYITSNDEIKDKGTWFLWFSQMNQEYSVHKYHSDAGYGIKTYTNFSGDGSSLLVNYSGVWGKIMAPRPAAVKKEVQLKYKDLLAQSLEEKSTEDRQFLVEQKRLQLDSDILATKQSLGNRQKERTKMLRSEELSFVELANIDDKIESLTKGLERLEAYSKMF